MGIIYKNKQPIPFRMLTRYDENTSKNSTTAGCAVVEFLLVTCKSFKYLFLDYTKPRPGFLSIPTLSS